MADFDAVVLTTPLKTAKGEINTITFRRGKARDMLAAQRVEPNDQARRELALMAILSVEKLTVEDIEELDLADLAEVQGRFREVFLPPTADGSATVGGNGDPGEMVPHATVGNRKA